MYVWKTLKIFISSTFKDLESERDGLAKIFHNLREQLFSRRLHLVLYDLRWQDKNEDKALVRWCLDTVAQSEYFIGILGYRYGWRPPKDYNDNENINNISITEMEIDYALHNIPQSKRLFFFGDFTQYTKQQLSSESPQDIESLKNLKAKLVERGEKIFTFVNDKELLLKIQQQLLDVFQNHYPEQKVELQAFNLQQAISEIVIEKSKGFVGRSEHLNSLISFCQDTSKDNYLVVNAVAGTGKSALLAQFIQHWQFQNTSPILVHYVSMAGTTKTSDGIVSSLYQQLRNIGWIKEDILPNKWRTTIHDVLKNAPTKIVIAIDGLDEMEDANLSWLPISVSSNVCFVITTRPVEIWKEISLLPHIKNIELSPLTQDEIFSITERYTNEKHIILNEEDKEVLMRRAAGNPLFLKVALDELAAGGIAVAQMAESIEALFRQILARLEKKYGNSLLYCYLGVIAASRNGIAEAELQEITNTGDSSCENNVVVKLSRELANFIVQRENLYHFFHPEFERSIKIFLGKKGMRDYHNIVAEYMNHKGFDYTRSLFELPYQLQWGESYLNLLKVLTDLQFIQKKCLSNMVLDLHQDFTRATSENAVLLPEDIVLEITKTVIVSAKTIEVLGSALEMDIQFIFRYPQHIFQTFWNRLFWHDNPEAAHHYTKTSNPPWQKQNKDKLYLLMEHWRSQFESQNNLWIKTLRPLPERIDSPLIKVIRGHQNKIGDIILHGNTLFSCSTDNTIRIWDIKSGTCIATIDHESEVVCICLTPDGKKLISGAKDNLIRIWDLKTYACINILEGHSDWVRRLVIDESSQKLFSASKDKTIRIWDLDTRSCTQVLEDHTSCVNDIVVRKNTLFSCSDDRTIRIWDIKQGICTFSLKKHTATIRRICVTKDEKTLISASYDRTIKIWDLEEKKELKTIYEQNAAVLGLTLTHDEKYIISGGSAKDKTIRVWNREGICVSVLKGHENGIETLITDEKDEIIISSSKDKTIRIWSMSQEDTSNELESHTQRVWTNHINKNGTHVISCGKDGCIKLWSMEKGNSILTFENNETIARAYLNNQGTKVFSTSSDGLIQIWDIEQKACTHSVQGHEKLVMILSFDESFAKFISFAKNSPDVKLWDDNLNLLQSFHHDNYVQNIYFAYKKNKIIVGTRDGNITIWDLPTNEKKIISSHKNNIYSFGTNEDHSIFASNSFDKVTHIWDLQTGEHIQTLEGHEQLVWSSIIIGKTAITGSRDKTVRFWDITSGKCTNIIEGICHADNFVELQNHYPIGREAETIILSKETNLPVAHFPVTFNNILMARNGIFCGRVYNQIYLLKLEGNV